MTKTMRAVRKLGPGPGAEVLEVPIPTIGPGEVLVKVEAASICGTDLHIWLWDEWSATRVKPPITMGHELAGTVVETGTGMEGAKVGDFVSAESHVTCGVCFQCRTGQAHMCPSTKILGVDRAGCFAEYVAVPEKVLWHTDRDKLPPEIATLQEPFGNAVFSALANDLTGQSGSSVPGSAFSGLKAALLHMGVIETDHVTAPFKPLSDEERGKIPGILAGLGLGDGR